MEIKVERLWKKDAYTIGKMYLNGEYFCNTLEDKERDLTKEKKVYGETAIPAGRYEVVYTYSPHFKRNLPRLLAVPQFDGVLIHAGNTTSDTLGCILVGENKEKGKVINSRMYSNILNKRVDMAIQNHEKVIIDIR